MKQRVESDLVKPPRVVYRLDNFLKPKYLVVGNKPYMRDGELKQSASCHEDIATALNMLEEHEKQFMK